MGDEQAFLSKEDHLRLRLYNLLLRKYSHLINDSEKKTIGEIKALINPEDLTIQSILLEHKPESFEFEKDYLHTAKALFGFICSEMNYVYSDLDINCWLTPKEMVSSKLGDDEDLAVFLCSLLYALGDENASVIIAELTDLSTHAFVLTEFKGKTFLLDPSQKHSFEQFSGGKKQALQSYSFNGITIKRFLYQFNSKEYKQFI